MSIPGSVHPLFLGASAGGSYQISRSLRFNTADSAYLSRTPASTGNRKTWTWAGWVKRSGLSTAGESLLSARVDNSNLIVIQFSGDNKLRIYLNLFGTYSDSYTIAYFRDTSAWYHFVFAVDTNAVADADRIKFYVNNTLQTFASTPNVTQSILTPFNSTGLHTIARGISGADGGLGLNYFSGYLADIHVIDGQALDPTSFTEVNATTGQLIPKAYTGTYGTNGFRLPFSDNSAATATTLGKDLSGNGNNWTPNNLSVTAGAGNDSLVDTPTSYGTDTGVGGEVRGNYATFDQLLTLSGDGYHGTTLSNGNLDFLTTPGDTGYLSTRVVNIGVSSGKWFLEITVTQFSPGVRIGITSNPKIINDTGGIGTNSTSWGYANNGSKYTNNSSVSYGATYTNGDIIGVALDLDAGTVVFYKNGSSQGTAYSSLPLGTYFFGVGGQNDGVTVSLNAGQRTFSYAAPSGFKALCDTNLPTPSIAKPNTVMDTVLYTGNGAARSITGLQFGPDLVWIKSRSALGNHRLTDSVRGVTKRLGSDLTTAETTDANGLTAFNSDGFSLGTDVSYNENGASYVGWTWDAGSSTVTNTAGSITSQVRANTSSGFSVVTYTGTGVNATIGHGLNVVPDMVIVKRLNGDTNWQVRHSSIAAASSIQLNLTSGATSATTVWNSTTPTSTVFSIGTNTTVNASTATYVAYCFAPVIGYSSFGSYAGNNSSFDDGPFVYLGFRPAVVILRRTNGVDNWLIFDDKREGYNVDNDTLLINGATIESTTDYIDILSNGFKVRTSNTAVNSGTLIYAAWASSPFQYSRAR